MNRVIKFRVFAAGVMRDDLHAGDCLNSYFSRATIPLMQFTGLTDTKGVEIYEGDIVSMHSEYIEGYPYPRDGVDDFNVQRIGEVRILASAGATIIRPTNLCNETGYKERHRWNVSLTASRSVVIGNIHQNPELLS